MFTYKRLKLANEAKIVQAYRNARRGGKTITMAMSIAAVRASRLTGRGRLSACDYTYRVLRAANVA